MDTEQKISDDFQHEYNKRMGYSTCYCSPCELKSGKRAILERLEKEFCDNCHVFMRTKCEHKKEINGI